MQVPLSIEVVRERAREVLGATGAKLRYSFNSPTARADLTAALPITALYVPHALGYAALAGVPVETGLYALPMALVAYAILGSSPQLIVGPVSTVSVLIGSIVAARNVSDPAEAVATVGVLAILSGLMLLLAGALRLGWIAEFLSKPIISGFVTGLSIVIIIGEFPVLLGLERGHGSLPRRLATFISNLDDLHWQTAVVGLGALAILFIGVRINATFPWGLVLVVTSVVMSRLLDLSSLGVAVVGEVPGGIPAPRLPSFSLIGDAGLVVGAAAITLVGLAESLSGARLFAARRGYRVDANQEFFATGAANIASSLVGGMGVAGSLSKTATADRLGSRSHLTSYAAAILVTLLILTIGGQLGPLPSAILSATLIRAVWGLIDVPSILRYRRIRTNDFFTALAALTGVVLFGTLIGVLGAIGLSVFGLVYRSGRLEVDTLGRVEGEEAAWGSLRRHADNTTVEGIVVLRLSAPLFWVNAAGASTLVLDEVGRQPDTKAVIIDLEATHQLDTGSADEMATLITVLRDRGIDVYLVRVMGPARDVLHAAGVIALLGPGHMWRTISQGVRAAQHDLKKARRRDDASRA